MSLSKLIVHPLSIQVHSDPLYFTKADPKCACLHCDEIMNKGPPVPMPTEEVKMGANEKSKEAEATIVFNASKIYCDDMCVAAALHAKNKPLYSIQRMNAVLYDCPMDAVVRTALPRWTLREYKGPLHKKEFIEFKQTGLIQRLLSYDSHDVFVNVESPLNLHRETERYRRLILVIQQLHLYYAFVFDPHSPIWSTNLSAKDNTKCYNDRHLIVNTKPTTVVVVTHSSGENNVSMEGLSQDPIKKSICSLLFCSPACGLRHLNRTLRDNNLRLAVDASHQLWSRYWFHGRRISVPRAPSVRTLLLFQGILSIDQFRASHASSLQVHTAPMEEDFPFDARLEDSHWVIAAEKQVWSFADSTFPYVEHADDPEFDFMMQQDALVHFPVKYHAIKQANTDTLGNGDNVPNLIQELPARDDPMVNTTLNTTSLLTTATSAAAASVSAAATSTQSFPSLTSCIGSGGCIHFQLSVIEVPAATKTTAETIRALVDR
jgi:hypothetical protein